MAVLMYKIVRMNVPDCLLGLFTRYVPRGNVRGVIKELEPPLMRKSYGFKSSRCEERIYGTLYPLRFETYRLSVGSSVQ